MERLRRNEPSLMGLEDWLGFVVFLASLAVSTMHVVDRMGEMALNTYHQVAGGRGIIVPEWLYVVTHQVGYLLLAESSMILFMVRWRLWSRHQPKATLIQRGRLLLSVDLLLAVLAMAFILVVNISSGLGLLEAVMPPFFTIGLGFSLEHLVVEWLERRERLAARLSKAYDAWEISVNEPTKHKDYRKVEAQYIWDAIASKNRRYTDVENTPILQRLQAIQREQERDTWLEKAENHQEIINSLKEEGGDSSEVNEMTEAQLFVESVKAKTSGDVKVGPLTANLDQMTWEDSRTGKNYGPYKSKGTMSAAIRQSLSRRGDLSS